MSLHIVETVSDCQNLTECLMQTISWKMWH